MRRFISIIISVVVLCSQVVLAHEEAPQAPSFDEAMAEFSSKMEEGHQAGMLLPVNVSKGLFLKVTTPPGFSLGSSKSHDQGDEQKMFITEFVPNGETVENWTRIITTQAFVGLGDKASALLEAVYKGVVDTVGEDNVDDPNIYLTTQIGYTESFMQVAYRNKGMDERLVIKIFSGPSDTAVAQMTCRYKPGDEGAADKYEQEFLEGVSLITKESVSELQ